MQILHFKNWAFKIYCIAEWINHFTCYFTMKTRLITVATNDLIEMVSFIVNRV